MRSAQRYPRRPLLSMQWDGENGRLIGFSRRGSAFILDQGTLHSDGLAIRVETRFFVSLETEFTDPLGSL